MTPNDAPVTPQLTLKATVPGKLPVTAPAPPQAATSGTTITFAVESTIPFAKPDLLDGANEPLDITFTSVGDAPTAALWTGTLAFTADTEGVHAHLEGADAPTDSELMSIRLVPASSDGGGGGGGGGGDDDNASLTPAETAIGEFDPQFAKQSGAVLRVVVFLLIGLVGWMVLWVMPMGGATDGDVAWGDRVAAAASALVLGIGAVAVVAGVWMATIEMRGRQRATVAGSDSATRTGFTLDPDALVKISKALSRVRGTIASFVIGIFLIALALAIPNGTKLVADAIPTTTTTVTPSPATTTTTTTTTVTTGVK